MAYPQGINFRQTAGYVTDGTGEDWHGVGGGGATYPTTTAQGNTVGWEDSLGSLLQDRNRNSGNNRRLAGMNFAGTTGTHRFRFDLPSSGSYNVRVAMGDASYAQTVDCELLDTTTSLGVLTSGSTGAANSFKAANGSTYTAANWVTNEATHLTNFTFSTTICRFRQSTASTQTGYTAHLYVEAAAAAGGQPTMRRWGGTPGMTPGQQSFGRGW